jgi:transposase
MFHKHYSVDRKRAAVEVFRKAQECLDQDHEISLSPMDLARAASGGASKREIYRWLKEDLSDAAIENKVENRGNHPLLSLDQVKLLLGFAVEQRCLHRAVYIQKLRVFCQSYFKLTVSKSTISNIMQNYGLSSQKSLARNSRMVSEEVVEAAIEAIEDIRGYGFPPHRIICMDETGVWSNTVKPKTYHFTNWCDNLDFFRIGIFPLTLLDLPSSALLISPPCSILYLIYLYIMLGEMLLLKNKVTLSAILLRSP